MPVPRFRRLLLDIHKLWKAELTVTSKVPIMTGKDGPAASKHELLPSEEDIVRAAIKATPAQLASPDRGGEAGLIVTALAVIVLFNRDPNREIYTMSDSMIRLRVGFQEIMKEFMPTSESFTFPDGFNSPILASALEKQVHKDIVRRRNVLAILQSRVNDVSRIDWGSLADSDGEPIPAIKRIVHDFLTVCSFSL